MYRPMGILSKGVLELSIELTERQTARFETYYNELTEWNRKFNLTAITEYAEVQVKHFLDSLTACLALDGQPPPGTKVIDVGAGAGFPGLPLKLAFPDICVVLTDSLGKRTRFLHHLVEVLDIADVEIFTGRAEELGHRPDLRENFDLVVSRGVAKLPVLLEYTLPFCKTRGRVIAWKHADIKQELADAEGALRTLGGQVSRIVPVQVSGLTDDRVLVIIDKCRATPDEYPRRPGVPAKRPIGNR
jgi:16S rRNA (guanine527-N7)-methyltransferase